MTREPDIVKIGAIILDDAGRLLIAKPRSNEFWLFVGGKLEAGESAEECLRRELREELDVGLADAPEHYLTSPIEPAAGDTRGRTVQIHAYRVGILGEPVASSEIERIHWLTADDFRAERFKLGSVLAEHLIPRLIEERLVA